MAATTDKKSFVIVSFILTLTLALLAHPCWAEVAVIQIYYRDASELLPMVEPFLSPEGKASVDDRTNTIIVNDTGEAVAKIRAFITQMDKPAEQVKIRFRFQQADLSKERDLSASGTASGEGWSVTTGEGEGDGVNVRVRDRRVNQRQDSESFISVASGSTAYIMVGRDVPFTERWIYLSRRYAHVAETVSYRRIETGMEVRPVVAGDRVHIEIVPRISSLEPGERGVIRFAEASTKLTVPRGQWVTIGGTSEQGNEVIRDILSSGSTQQDSTLLLSLMVE